MFNPLFHLNDCSAHFTINSLALMKVAIKLFLVKHYELKQVMIASIQQREKQHTMKSEPLN